MRSLHSGLSSARNYGIEYFCHFCHFSSSYIQAVHFEQEIKESENQDAVFRVPGADHVFDDDDFFEVVIDVAERAGFLFGLFARFEMERRLNVVAAAALVADEIDFGAFPLVALADFDHPDIDVIAAHSILMMWSSGTPLSRRDVRKSGSSR